MPVEIPYRLAARARLYAQNIADSFQAIVDAINGGLSAANYISGVSIANANKAASRTVAEMRFVIPPREYIGAPGTQTYKQRIHSAAPGTSIRWSVTRGDVGVNPWAVATARLYRNGVQVGTSRRLDPGGGGADFTEVAEEGPGNPDSLWTVEVSGSGVGWVPMLAVSVSVKTPHVR